MPNFSDLDADGSDMEDGNSDMEETEKDLHGKNSDIKLSYNVVHNSQHYRAYEEDDAETAAWWKVVEEAVLAIQEARPAIDGSTQEDLYRCVESFITAQSPKELYNRLKDVTELYIMRRLKQLLDSSADRLVFLKEVNFCWKQFCDQMKMVCNIFLSLDRGYVLQNSQVMSIWDMGLELFRVHVMGEAVVETRVIDGLLMMVQKERAGETIDRSLIKSLLRMLSSLHLYTSVFQTKFLQSSEELYSREGCRLLQELTVPDYLRHVINKLPFRPQLVHLLVKQLLGEHKTTIIQKGLDDMLNEHRKDDFRLLYNLMGRVKGGHQLLCSSFNAHIKAHGKTIVTEPLKDKAMVQELLTFKDRLDEMVNECCGRNDKFVQAVREAFEYFINTRLNKPAELIEQIVDVTCGEEVLIELMPSLHVFDIKYNDNNFIPAAKFIDSKLRAGNKEATEDELERLLDKIMVLFRFINGKDVFEAFYKKSASVDAEKSMLSKLKAECGPNFTGKLEGMFKDMELSKDFMLSFKQNTARHNTNLSMELSVSILTHGFWPSYPDSELILSPEMVQYQKIFTEFYRNKHSGRKLMFKAGDKELQVSLFQALVLLLFNTTDDQSYADIKALTNIDVEEQLKTEERVYQDRQYQIDAAVVRIMKTRKNLTHNHLITELFDQLKFPVKANDLKKRIESLIDRDYMERDKDNPNAYNYIA
ncbi:hypothetical protein HAZT_HAZT006072 [Hyalella azteca]|uniref:Cullin family profile domain-containing protein n=1 Tax=Hyalella azteca TaxID=294128 RepID=A0A6A0H8U5_HYAAZ|nr:hypothetical protein HAZT_HAZT006072 [Hyalella azteca]